MACKRCNENDNNRVKSGLDYQSRIAQIDTNNDGIIRVVYLVGGGIYTVVKKSELVKGIQIAFETEPKYSIENPVPIGKKTGKKK